MMDQEWDYIRKFHTEFMNMLKTFNQYRRVPYFGKIIDDAVLEYNKIWTGKKVRLYYESTGFTQINKRIQDMIDSQKILQSNS